MAMDLAGTPSTGIRVQACGDAHVNNFGKFASPERNLVFDINDFDETVPGPWEWDIKRLAASLQVVARQREFSPDHAEAVVTAAVRSYRERIADYSTWPMLASGMNAPRSRPSSSTFRCDTAAVWSTMPTVHVAKTIFVR